MISGQRVAVLIPAYDEEASLPGVLAAMPRAVVDEVVVVDNGSRDATAAVAARHGATVVQEPRRGYGAACLAGVRRLASGELPDIVLFVDADWNGDPAEVERVVGPVVAGTADLVIGARMGAENRSAMPWHARAGNRFVLELVRTLFGHRFADLGPFRAIRFTSLLALHMDDRDWGWTLQMQIRAAELGLRVLEVPVAHRRRAIGRSKISGSVTGSARAGAKMLYTLARERLATRS